MNRSYDSLIVNGIDLNSEEMCTSEAWSLEKCKAFVEASGTLTSEEEGKYANLNFNQWVVAKRLIEIIDHYSTLVLNPDAIKVNLEVFVNGKKVS